MAWGPSCYPVLLCKSLLIILICHLWCLFILPFQLALMLLEERDILPYILLWSFWYLVLGSLPTGTGTAVDELKVVFCLIKVFTMIHGILWKCLMTLSFRHRIVDKLSFASCSLLCRGKLFPYTYTHEVQAMGTLCWLLFPALIISHVFGV